MFSVYTHLNEGGCTKSNNNCIKRKLFEGTNPKPEVFGTNFNGLQTDKSPKLLNSHWEKLR